MHQQIYNEVTLFNVGSSRHWIYPEFEIMTFPNLKWDLFHDFSPRGPLGVRRPQFEKHQVQAKAFIWCFFHFKALLPAHIQNEHQKERAWKHWLKVAVKCSFVAKLFSQLHVRAKVSASPVCQGVVPVWPAVQHSDEVHRGSDSDTQSEGKSGDHQPAAPSR